MAKYLAYQIILQKLKYNTVITRFPKYKEDIDKVLHDRGIVTGKQIGRAHV